MIHRNSKNLRLVFLVLSVIAFNEVKMDANRQATPGGEVDMPPVRPDHEDKSKMTLSDTLSTNQRHTSVAVSDFILAVSAFNAAFAVIATSKLGALGFSTIGSAATLGVARFVSSTPSPQLVGLHGLFSWLSSTIGLSSLAAALYRSNGQYMMSSAHMAASLALTAVTRVLTPEIQELASQGVTISAVISILTFSIFRFNPYGLVGALIFILSAVIGTKGTLLGMKRVDWFHYVLVFGNVALMKALQQYEPLIYYRPIK